MLHFGLGRDRLCSGSSFPPGLLPSSLLPALSFQLQAFLLFSSLPSPSTLLITLSSMLERYLYRPWESYNSHVQSFPCHIPLRTSSFTSLLHRLTRNISLSLSLPIVFSPMDAVTEAPMTISVATLGGIGILHSNASPAHQASFVHAVKSRHFPSLSDPVYVAPDVVAADYPDTGCILVSADGDQLLGVLPVTEWGQVQPASDCLYHRYAVMPESSNFEEVAAKMARVQYFMPLVADISKVVGVVTKADVERIRGYPNLGKPSVGDDGKLRVEAVIGTRKEDKVTLEH